MSNFDFLKDEFPILYNTALAAEYHLHEDPVTALFKLRQFAERLTQILYEEHQIEFPYNTQFLPLLKGLEFEGILPAAVKDLLHNIRIKGNDAVHDQKGTVQDAKSILYAAFKISKWFYETYAEESIDLSNHRFAPPKNLDARHALHELEKEHEELKKKFEKTLKDRKLSGLKQEEKVAIKERSEKALKKLELNEAETRQIIDNQLSQAGWEVNTEELNFKKYKTLPERGKNLAIAEWPCNGKWADYALFIGTKLYGIIEAKKYAEDISTNLDQSKIYAQLVEPKNEAELLGKWENYKVPFLFSTNGRPYLQQIKTKSGVWFLDVRDTYNNSRALQGWYSPEGLEDLYDRNIQQAEDKLKTESSAFLQNELGLRDYQLKAIQAVERKLLNSPADFRTLIAMATGTGKTRTIIGLCYRLIQSNRFRRILFLVDRTMLAGQTYDDFADNKIVGLNTFAEIYDVQGLKDAVPTEDTRLHFATVQGMVKRLFYTEEEVPSVDQYDCIIIDEAHRGYLLDKELDEEELNFKNQLDYISKYRMVLDYFDAHAIALTATPALHTKEIFGTPVYTYSYREAVIDGYLIDHDPPYIIKTELGEKGIIWKKGEKPKALNRESNEIVDLAELEDELKIEVTGFNKKVITEPFNRTVIQQLVKELDPDGEEKTLVFAATDEHADRVVQIFKEEFEKIGIPVEEDTIQKITGKSYKPSEQLKRFKNEKYPNIAVTVDLLTTGIDVPAICNIVFLRRIKSRILFEQMLGRATRRCDEIGKDIFRIYDAVKIYETLEDYTQMKPVVANPSTTFTQLANELDDIESEERTEKQIEQIIAKIQRKKHYFNKEDLNKFEYNCQGLGPDELIDKLKTWGIKESVDHVQSNFGLWKFLDEFKPRTNWQLVSEHPDQFKAIERGYGKAKKPDDYLESFAQFIKENQNKIQALKIVCTKPAELDRKSLKELMLELDQNGFNEASLNAAWKDAKNEEIAADIIAYIRTLALGTSLRTREERVKNAVNKVREMKQWNKGQLRWLERFENQLIADSVLQKPDLERGLFKEKGGFKRLNLIFEEDLENIIKEINQNLYTDIA